MRPRQLLKTCLLFTVTSTFACGQAAANLEITIHVDDYAGIDPGLLAETEAIAARILQEAGLRTQWSNCRFSTTERTCAATGGGVTHLYIRLLPEAMAGKLAASTKILGMSLPISRGTFPVGAYVFSERVGVFAEQNRDLVPPLLGAAITHEVGHLLLAGNAHTVTGLMSAHWGPKERQDALMGVLTFSRRQSEQIRADVSQRMSGSNQRAPIANEERRIEPNRGRLRQRADRSIRMHRTYEKDRRLAPPASGADSQLFPGSKADFQWGRGRPEQQS
jgi:hypothetical protein